MFRYCKTGAGCRLNRHSPIMTHKSCHQCFMLGEFHFQRLTLSVLPSSHPSFLFGHRQSGSVRSGQVISGLIGRLMLLQEPGTLKCLSSPRVCFLLNQTCWRLTKTQTTGFFVLFSSFFKDASQMGKIGQQGSKAQGMTAGSHCRLCLSGM